MRWAIPLLWLLVACADPAGEDVEPDCPAPFESATCGELRCFEPEARLASAHGPHDWVYLEEGAPLAAEFGGQTSTCCYHVMVGVETEGLCPIVEISVAFSLEDGDGALVSLHDQVRNVQMVREEPARSIQRFWGLRSMIPCGWWPDDPAHPDAACPEGAGSRGRIEDQPVHLRVTVEDRDGRRATDEAWLDSWCCTDQS